MSSIINVWGTLVFPPDAQPSWRALTLDGGAESGESESEYAGYFADEHPTIAIEEALARAEDAHPFARFESRGSALHVRAALGDDDWSEWLALLGGMARAAAGLGADGMLEVEDDGRFVGRLLVSKKGTVWKEAALGHVPRDKAGASALNAIFDELHAASAAKAKAPAEPAAVVEAPAKSARTTKAPARKVARKAPAEKAATSKATEKAATSKATDKAATSKATDKAAASKATEKAAASKATAKETAAGKAPDKAATKKAPAKGTAKKAPERAAAMKAPATKATAGKAPAKKAAKKKAPARKR